jgi:SAM-dependent methyltransferase
MNIYDYENSPQGLLSDDSKLNLNYLFLFDHIKNYLRINERMRILEIGTGGGRNLKVLHGQFSDKIEIFGTDISSSAIKYATSLKIGTFSLARSDVIPFEEKFDLILMIDILEHLDKSETVVKTLNNAQNYLNESGNIYVSVPTELNRFCLTWVFSKFSYFKNLTKNFYGHLIQFDAKSFILLIDLKKFTIKKHFYSVHFFSQFQVLLFFYIPKILIKFFLGERLANNLRDSNEIIKYGSGSFLNILKKIYVRLSYPLAYLGFRETCIRKNSFFAAGNLHLLIASKNIK